MSTNAGKKVLNVEADMPGVSRALLDTDAMANILGLTYLTDKYRVTMDSAVEDAFLVHLPGGKIVKFDRKKQRLYTYTVPESVKAKLRKAKGLSNEMVLSDKTDKAVVHLIDSVAENMKGFTKRQIDRAREARNWARCICLPPDRSLKQAIQQNLWKDNPVTLKDIEVAEKIWGPDIGILRGRTTRRRPPVIRGEEDRIEIPPELKMHQQDLELCIDLMYINSMGMMTGIDKSIIFRSLHSKLLGEGRRLLQSYRQDATSI